MPKGRFSHKDMPTVADMRAKARIGSRHFETCPQNWSAARTTSPIAAAPRNVFWDRPGAKMGPESGPYFGGRLQANYNSRGLSPAPFF